MIDSVFAVEISGACNLDNYCQWCPMFSRPRNRPRGFMSDEMVKRSLHWVDKTNTKDKIDALALHDFGEPLLHPKFLTIAEEFSNMVPITISTNAMLIDEKMADNLAKIKWAWITISPWNPMAAKRANKLLYERKIKVKSAPGIEHNWAGQSAGNNDEKRFNCHFIKNNKAVIRWNGEVTTCCITDRLEDTIGHINQEPEDVSVRAYSLCDNCHHSI